MPDRHHLSAQQAAFVHHDGTERPVHTYACRECGQRERVNYTGPIAESMLRRRVCFSCNLWLDHVDARDDPETVCIGGVQYRIGPEDADHVMRGYGGRPFLILFHDGRSVRTTNLWCNGEIPPHFQKRLPDNAKFAMERGG